MKRFREWLAEAEHYIDGYDKWGIVSAKRGIVSGNRHKSATTHSDLYAHDEIGSKVEYAQDKEGGFLSLRTHGPKALDLAIKHFPALPHMRTGMVTHTHFDGFGGMTETSGKSYQILEKMKGLVKK